MKKNRSRPVEKAFDDVALSSSIMQCPLCRFKLESPSPPQSSSSPPQSSSSPSSCNAGCGFQLESAQFQRTAMQVINCTGRDIQGGNGLQKSFEVFRWREKLVKRPKQVRPSLPKKLFLLLFIFHRRQLETLRDIPDALTFCQPWRWAERSIGGGALLQCDGEDIMCLR